MQFNTVDQKIVAGFFYGFLRTETEIAFRGCFIDRENRRRDGHLNLMPIINHPERRVILKDGQWAKMTTEHPDPKLQYLNNSILLRGTPYGLIVMFGRTIEYEAQQNGHVLGPIPELHALANFTMAAMRVAKRKGEKLFGDKDLLKWIFSDNFEQELQEQVELDKQAGLMVSDGLPPRRPPQQTGRKERPSQPVLTSHEGKRKPALQRNDKSRTRRPDVLAA